MSKRYGSLLSLLLIFALALTACGSNASTGASSAPTGNLPTLAAGQTVTLQFASYNYGTPGLGGKGIQDLINQFEAKYPNIKIEGKNIPAADILQKLTAEVAAGTQPEIAQIPLSTLDYAVNNMKVQPINKLVAGSEYNAFTQHILPQALNLGAENSNLYIAPFTFSTPTLFYNATLFKQAGLDPDKPPTTWDEVLQYSRQIKAKTGALPIVVDTPPGNGDWIMQSLIYSNGGTVLSPDRTQATFNQAPAAQALSMWQNLVKQGLEPKLGVSDAYGAMMNGKLAMFIDSTVLLPIFENASQGKFELRTAEEPAFGTKAVVPTNSGSGISILTKDPLKQRAAWTFLQFVDSQQGVTTIASEMGYLPLRDDVVNNPNYLQPYLAKNPLLKPALAQLAHLHQDVPWPGSSGTQAQLIFLTAVTNIVYQGQPVQQTLDDAANRVNSMLQAGA